MRNPNNRSTIAPPRTQLSKQPIDPAQVASEANKCPQESRGSTPTERRNALETSAFCNAVGNKIIVTVIVALISWLDRTGKFEFGCCWLMQPRKIDISFEVSKVDIGAHLSVTLIT